MILFAEVLRRDRKRLNLSQIELSKRVGVHQQMVSLWERGKGAINEDQKTKLVEVLGPESELALNFKSVDFGRLRYERRTKYEGTTKNHLWMGLTLDDLDGLVVSKEWIAGARWAEAKLKEKNA